MKGRLGPLISLLLRDYDEKSVPSSEVLEDEEVQRTGRKDETR